MTDRANTPVGELPTPPVITAASRLGIGVELRADGSSNTPVTGTNPFAANDLLAFPITLNTRTKVTKVFWLNGSAAGSNWAGAIYDADFNKIVQSASTAGSGNNVPQAAAMAATLPPGMYYLALATDANTTNRIFRWPGSANLLRLRGVWKQTGVTLAALPNPATPAAHTAAMFPVFGIITRAGFDV